MNTNGFNHQFPPGLPPGQHVYFQQSQSQVPFMTPSQVQIPSAFCQPSPQGQVWPSQDRFAPSMLPGTQQGVPQWVQLPFFGQQQHQQLLQPIGVRQPFQQPEYLPQRPVQSYYHPQPPDQEHHPQPSVRPGYTSQHSVQDLAAAVAVQLGYTRNIEPAPAIAQCANNDKIVIDALKQGKAKGLDDLVAIEKLGNANGYANNLWKNYYIARLPKIYPKIHRTCTSTRRGVARPRVSSCQPSSRTGAPSGSRKQNSTGIGIHANPIAFMDRRLGHDFQAYQPSSPISEHQGAPTKMQVRSRRGGPIPEYHAGTLIPTLDLSLQPKPTLWDPENIHQSQRFSDEDKIFFIHFLKWYLRQGSVAHIPDREELYLLLARQTPHHNADAWKRHWDDAPELPDKIYIEARKRADDEALARSASLSPSSNEDGSEDDIDAADRDGPLNESTSQVLNQVQRVPYPPCARKKTRKYEKVTEEDLREMAQYKYEQRDVWEQTHSSMARWKEFAQRPQNQKRTLNGWYTAFRTYSEDINRYYNEYAAASAIAVSDERSEADAESELEYLDVPSPSQRDSGSASSVSTSSGPDTQTTEEVLALPDVKTVPQKRDRTDSEETACSLASAEEVFPGAKRMKEEEGEKPELLHYDSD